MELDIDFGALDGSDFQAPLPIFNLEAELTNLTSKELFERAIEFGVRTDIEDRNDLRELSEEEKRDLMKKMRWKNQEKIEMENRRRAEAASQERMRRYSRNQQAQAGALVAIAVCCVIS